MHNPRDDFRVDSNNFGALRLLFASLVIVGHSFEQTVGGWPSEILTQITGTLDFGESAVNGFFLISGYLIAASYENSSSVKRFLIKRCLRIYPAFAMASIISVFVFAPLAGGWGLFSHYTWEDWLKIPIKILTLDMPWVNGAFGSISLNIPLWTIRWEFLCYLSVPVLAYLGLYKRRAFFQIVLAMLALYLWVVIYNAQHGTDSIYTSPVRFLTTFFVGVAFYLYRDLIRYNRQRTFTCALLLGLLITHVYFARHVLILCGGYLMFNFAFNFKNAFLSSIGRTNDISYGVYLYAWPFQILMIRDNPQISPWVLTAYAFVFAILMGFVSSYLVEKPFMQMKRFFN